MRVLSARESAALSNTAKLTLHNALIWVVIAIGIGWLSSTYVRFPVWTWLTVLTWSFLLELLSQRPIRRYPARPLTVADRAVMLTGVFVLNAMFSIPCIFLFHEGTAGCVGAVMVVCGTLLSALVTCRQHRGLMVAATLPNAFYLIGLPLVDIVHYGPDPQRLMIFGACALFLFGNVPLVVLMLQIARSEIDHREGLECARAEAEKANDAKSAFVAMVSHELRTPISAILAGSEAIIHNPQGARVENNAGLILDAGKMMRILLNDLLDLAKLDTGRMTVEAIPFDLRSLAFDMTQFWAAEARRKGVRLRLEDARSAPRWVSGDPTRLRQILNNFFSNAIKFTEHGAVCLVFGRDAAGLTFTVRDTGPGLTPTQVERLFIPYEQADHSVSRTHGGTGLGLAISLKLALLMGGKITVTSALGQGSAFTLHLPLPITAGVPKDEALEAALALRILVVDDHEVNRRALSLMLEPTGAALTLADGGETALQLLKARVFDVILMDVNMPSMDGWETTRRLRASAGPNRATPVLAITGSADEAAMGACLAAGMNGRVVKPIQVADLFAALAALESENAVEIAAA